MALRIDVWAAKKRLTDTQLAEVLDVHRTTLFRWRGRKHIPTTLKMLEIEGITAGFVQPKHWLEGLQAEAPGEIAAAPQADTAI